MIVYGDPSHIALLKDLISAVSQTAGAISKCTTLEFRLDLLRRALIEAGQAEQAAEDCGACADLLRRELRAATDALSETFLAAWAGDPGADALAMRAMKTVGEIDAQVHSMALPSVRVKLPEGFAFYSLFPEQYIASARAWSAAQGARGGSVLVVGIRSIGTTLSAVVRAALNRDGWDVRRMTVRPAGHPFARRVDFSLEIASDAQHALIVDEGPGASGSSMAAAARGLVAAGLDPSHISFLPGHGGEPGPEASAEVRQWWATIRRYVMALDELRWSGRSLKEKLVEHTLALLPGAPVVRIEDLSAGGWRGLLFPGDVDAPPAFSAFERTKYRCVLRDGRSVLWKFVGLTRESEAIVVQIRRRAGAGWTASPLATAFGFVALRWIDGTPLVRQALSPCLLEQIGRYIRESAGPALGTDEQSAAFERLGEMLYWNARESLGDAAAQRARRLADQARRCIGDQPASCYGDGRLAPYEWILTPSGQLQKVDCAGHDCDHTVIGRQPIIWDVAGAAVEWEMGPAESDELSELALTQDAPPVLFQFYRAAYAAFRLGMASMCGADVGPYCNHLALQLNCIA